MKKQILNGEAKQAFQQGKDHWNDWIDTLGACDIDLSNTVFEELADFSGYKFPADAKILFENSVFKKGAKFNNVIFKKDSIDIENAVFEEGTFFERSVFMDKIRFSSDQLKQNVSFKKSRFKGNISITGDWKDKSINFEDATFENGANFDSAKIYSLSLFNAKFKGPKKVAPDGKYRDLSFQGTKLLGSDLFFKYCKFENCNIHFEGTTLSGILHFENTTLENTKIKIDDCTGSAIFDFEWSDIHCPQLNIVNCKRALNDRKPKIQFYFRSQEIKLLNLLVHNSDLSSLTIGTAQTKIKSGNIEIKRTTIASSNIDIKHLTIENGGIAFEESNFIGGNLNLGNSCLGNQRCSFDKSIFHKDSKIDFSYSNFKGPATFINTQFYQENPISFRGALFGGGLDLKGLQTGVHFDLDHAEIKQHFRLTGEEFPLNPKEEFSAEAASEFKRKVSLHFRRLKELSASNKDHDLEIEFFSKELTTREGLSKIPGILYGFFSDFGRSITLPALWLIDTILWSAIYYWSRSGSQAERLYDSLLFSIGNIVGMTGLAKTVNEQASKILYRGSIPHEVQTVAVLESMLGATFVFLILLAVRNRFRI